MDVVEQLELEGIAEAVLVEGQQADDEAPRVLALALTILGNDAVEYTPVRLPGDGALVRVNGAWRIYVRRGLAVERRTFIIAHELAEWWMRAHADYRGADVEDCADYIAAAILSPRRAFARAVRAVGHDFGELARAFRSTETLVALREAELTHQPRAVITPSTVRVRGPEAWVWPDEETLRRWARRPITGVRKVRLGDDPRRVVLDVEERDVS